MLYHSLNLLESTELSAIVNKLMSSPDWIDGAVSASGGAKLLKRNIQLSPLSDTYKDLEKRISELLMDDRHSFANYIYPKKIINILFSRTSVGMYYGHHMDSAYTSQGRRDYSFTLFLNDPSDYEGGELILNILPEQKSIKLGAGSIIIYPTKYLHEVREVSQGERLVCVGWIESFIKKDEEREMLGYVKNALQQLSRSSNDNHKSILSLNIAFQRLQKYFGD